jgi:hypothetical protein
MPLYFSYDTYPSSDRTFTISLTLAGDTFMNSASSVVLATPLPSVSLRMLMR